MGIVQLGSPGPPTQGTGSGTVFSAPTVVVSTKVSWAEDWTIEPRLIPLRATSSLAPSISTAYFRFDFGDRTTETDPAYATLDALGLRNEYVKIETFTANSPAVPVLVWIGQLVHDGRKPAGIEPPTATGIPAGVQMFTAYGLEHLLKKIPIDESRVLQGGNEESDIIRTKRGLQFNRARSRGGPLDGNGDEFVNAAGTIVPAFGDAGFVWNHADIVKYLLENFVNERTAPQFKLIDFAGAAQSVETVENLFGMTVFDALSKLLDRRRGLTWKTRVDPSGVFVEIVVQTTIDTAVSIGDAFIPGNPNVTSIDVDPDIRVVDFSVNESSTNRYTEVQVRGAPIRVMFTLSPDDGTIEPAWSTADETAYADAGKTADGYDVLTVTEKARLNDQLRRHDPILSRVYTTFRVPDTFVWRVGLGFGNVPSDIVATPTADPIAGDVQLLPNPPATLNGDKVFASKLLIAKGLDYSVSPPTDNNPAGRIPEFADPFVIVLAGPGVVQKHWPAHQMGQQSGANLPTAGLRLADNEMGFQVSLAGGSLPHSWGRAHFDAETAEPTLFTPSQANAVKWNRLLITAAVELDVRPIKSVDLTTGSTDNESVLVLDFPDLHYWYGVPGTVIGVDEKGFVKRLDDGNAILRDDTHKIRQIAAFAAVWYSRERRGVRLVRQTFDVPILGSILQTISHGQTQTQVNAVVSTIEHDFLAFTAAIVTDFQELDFAAVFGGNASTVGAGSGSLTPTFGTFAHAASSADERIARLDEESATNIIHQVSAEIGITDAFIGKVVEYYRDRCFVARMEYGDPEQWNLNTFTDIVKCVWKGVGTSIVSNDPVFCFKPANSSKYVALAWFNDVGNWDDAGGTNGEFHFNPPSNVIDPDPSATSAFPPFGGASNSECIPGSVP